jgi:glucan biosynthesis protein C
MPVFFTLAGLTAARSYAAHGAGPFLVERLRRLAGPLMVGLISIIPLTYVVFALGLLASGQCSMTQMVRLSFPAWLRAELIGPFHLWFLEYLLLFSFLYVAGNSLAVAMAPRLKRRPISEYLDHLLVSPARPVLLALVSGFILWADPDAFIRVHNSFIPDPGRFTFELLFFLCGTRLARVRVLNQALVPWSTLYLALSVPVYLAMCRLASRHMIEPLHGNTLAGFICFISLFSSLSLFGLLGVSLWLVRQSSGPLRYLGSLSFGVYFCHLPVVGLMQALLAQARWPAALKFAAVLIVAFAASVALYHLMLSRPLLGSLLGARATPATAQQRLPLGSFALAGSLLAVLLGGAWLLSGIWWADNLHAVIAGRLYRSAPLAPAHARKVLRRLDVHSVVSVSGGKRAAAERRLCLSLGIPYSCLELDPDRLPTRGELGLLVHLIDASPAPLLIQGRWGLGATALAAAVAELLAGAEPRQALYQFGLRYGHLGVERHAEVLRAYRSWLAARRRLHSPDIFRGWVRGDYEPDSVPPPMVRPEHRRDLEPSPAVAATTR